MIKLKSYYFLASNCFLFEYHVLKQQKSLISVSSIFLKNMPKNKNSKKDQELVS